MPPLTIAALAHALAEAPALPDALRVLRSQLDEISRGLQLAYFRCDPRRQLVIERLRVTERDVVSEPIELSLDHLPPKLRRDVFAGGALVDFGEQSADYLKFFGMEDPAEGYLLLQGVQFDGELCGVTALREPRQRFGNRVVDRITAPLGLFALAVSQSAQRDARREAERAVEELLARVHEEYGRTLGVLRQQLSDMRRQLEPTGANQRVAELERAARAAAEESREALARLTAVEQQVSAAVSQLEKAHLDLSRQSDALRSQGNLLHRIEQILTESAAHEDPRKVLEEVLEAVSARTIRGD
jgi:hypothetical protein